MSENEKLKIACDNLKQAIKNKKTETDYKKLWSDFSKKTKKSKTTFSKK